MRNRTLPFSAPLVLQARQKARRANARPRIPKSPKPITRDLLETILAGCDDIRCGYRDRAMVMLAFASGGRRRSETSGLNIGGIGRDAFAATGLVRIRLLETKTTRKDRAPRLPLKGRAAWALVQWPGVSGQKAGPLFCPLSSRLDQHARMACRCIEREIHGIGLKTRSVGLRGGGTLHGIADRLQAVRR